MLTKNEIQSILDKKINRSKEKLKKAKNQQSREANINNINIYERLKANDVIINGKYRRKGLLKLIQKLYEHENKILYQQQNKKIAKQGIIKKKKQKQPPNKFMMDLIKSISGGNGIVHQDINNDNTVSICKKDSNENNTKKAKKCRLCGGNMIKLQKGGYKCENSPTCSGAIKSWQPF
jgi:hypothetical protein